MRAAFSLLILLTAIQTYSVSSADTLKAKIDGRWEWVKTSGGFSGEIYTPQSVHYSLTLVFSKNVPQQKSDSIRYQVYRSDTLILSGITSITLANMPAFGPNNRIIPDVSKVSDTLLFCNFGIEEGFSSIFVRPKTSLKMVRGTISDSATGAPISNVKVVLMQMAGEIELMLDSSRTETDGGYSFSFLGQSGYGLYIYTISEHYYYQSKSIGSIGIDDTITDDIKLKRISTIVSAAPHFEALQNITVRTAKSRLYLSGIKAKAIVDIYNLNGRLLFRTVIPAGASEVGMPEWIAASGCYQVSIRGSGHLIRGMVISR
jgi:5-hydroxyisourate hydrolase-like protein (transthyretin family)